MADVVKFKPAGACLPGRPSGPADRPEKRILGLPSAWAVQLIRRMIPARIIDR
jgi:hypothetical protein